MDEFDKLLAQLKNDSQILAELLQSYDEERVVLEKVACHERRLISELEADPVGGVKKVAKFMEDVISGEEQLL